MAHSRCARPLCPSDISPAERGKPPSPPDQVRGRLWPSPIKGEGMDSGFRRNDSSCADSTMVLSRLFSFLADWGSGFHAALDEWSFEHYSACAS